MWVRMRALEVFGLTLVLCCAASSLAQAADMDAEKILNIYNWQDYLGPDTIQKFEERYGIKVNVETFDDEDVMVSGVQSNPAQYDVIISSGRIIAELIEMRLLAKLDLSRVPNLVNIDPRFRDPSYDPQNKYSVPYMWGTTAFAVNRAYIKEEPNTWAILWNPAYAGKISMLPSGPEVIGAALKLLGYSLNSANVQELQQARVKLLEQRPLLAGFIETIDVRDKLIANELWAAQVYVGEALVAAKENPNIQYVIPKEGATIWIDNMAIPRDALHKKNAELFINFVLEPRISAAISNELWYANPNAAARAQALPEILQNPFLYPSEEVLSACEVLLPTASSDEGQRRQRLINEIWAQLQRATPR